jgi:NADPH:quinone reductase-like Zn-dependent oxidoreductase
MPRFPREAAAYAEYVTSPSRHLARIPAGLSDVDAAALPLAGLTAWQALVETAEVERGTRVLVLAAAGGVGHLAVQIAKARGAHVIGTARAEKHAFLASLGAVEAVDYTSGPLAQRVRDVDVVLDLVGPEAAADALPALRDGGVLVTAASGAGIGPLRDAAAGRVRVAGILVEPDRLGMEALAALVSEGALRPHVAGTFPLADAARAHEQSETGRTQGKLVLTVD